MIEKENAELRAMGVVEEDDTPILKLGKGSEKKEKKMTSGSQLLLKVVSSMNDLKSIEKVNTMMLS